MPPATTATTEAAPAATATPENKSPSPVDIMMSRLGYQAEETKKSAEEKKDAAPAATLPAKTTEELAAESAAAEKAKADATKPEIKKVKRAAPVAPIDLAAVTAAAEAGTKAALAESKPAAPVAAAPAVAEPTLSPDDQSDLEIAAYAASKMTDKYKDIDAKMKAWFTARDQFIEAKAKEFGGAKSPEFREFLEGEDFKDFIKANRPTINPRDRKTLEHEKIKDEVTAAAKREQAEMEKKFKRELAAIKLEPQIEARTSEVVEELLTGDDEVVKAFKENPDAALESFPIEAKEVHQITSSIQNATKEYLRVANGLADGDAKNPLHVWMNDFITEQGRVLDKQPTEKRLREDGRLLVSHMTYDELVKKDPAAAKKYATFTNDDVVFMLTELGRKTINGKLKEVRGVLEKSGYSRAKPAPVATDDAAKAAAAAAEAAKAAATQSPKGGSSRAPGHKGDATPDTPIHLRVLGYGKK